VAKLILGPLLRRVTGDQAVLWLQTDSPADVKITAGQAVAEVRTREIQGVHLALPVLSDLPAGQTAYTVDIDGERVWPLPDRPPSVITVNTSADEITIAFGSCREAVEIGVDALAAYARRAIAGAPLPDLLALIGDQVYADELSPETTQWLSTRERHPDAPPNNVVGFAEYVHLYEESWSQPDVRWLLSTVSTIMIFDDHEIIDDWNSSASWLAEISKQPWWQERITAGLHSYWLFQHLGNLHPKELAEADWETPPKRWGYTLDLGRTRLIMLDCRGSRVLDEPRRRMFPQDEWDRLAEDSQADCDHLVIACSLPWLLAPAIHHAQAVMEMASTRFGGTMEKLRRSFDLEHWSAVGDSFAELSRVIQAVDTPATVSLISGDVHHSYVAAAMLPGRPRVNQITCSPLRNKVPWIMKAMLKVGWWRGISGPGSLIAKVARVQPAGFKWTLLERPFFSNAIGTLTHRGRQSTVTLEGTGKDEKLHNLVVHRLA
jgi:hypothetical protein